MKNSKVDYIRKNKDQLKHNVLVCDQKKDNQVADKCSESSDNLKKYDFHTPVMLNEVLDYLSPKDGEVIVDCTFGAGGYTGGILDKTNCKVIGLDRDESVKPFVDNIKNKFGNRFEFHNTKYSNLEKVLNGQKVDGIVLDIGVSSMQIDQAERGFSFQKNSKLDMRMGENSVSAYDLINNLEERELADIIYNYGDEVKSRHIAKRIVEKRKIKPIETTLELANIVRFFYKNDKGKIDPATKTFQAIRIAVNDELNELRQVLELSKKILKVDGRLVVVTFHSLEDKIVKDFVKKETNYGEKNDKYAQEKKEVDYVLLTKKAVSPTDAEISSNIRSRSAKLRALRKC